MQRVRQNVRSAAAKHGIDRGDDNGVDRHGAGFRHLLADWGLVRVAVEASLVRVAVEGSQKEGAIMAWIDAAIIVDVSHWDREDDSRTHHRLMDWDAAVKAGLAGVVIKYSQGVAGVDPAAFLHAYNAYQAGVPLLGGYHFGD